MSIGKNMKKIESEKQKKETILKKIIIIVILSAITFYMGRSELGLIPVPTAANNATILHIPPIIGGILTGWIGGAIIGLSFGISSFLSSEIPLFQDIFVSIFPRIFIGITAYLTYKASRKLNESLGIIIAATTGTLTNTILVLTMAVLRGHMSSKAALSAALVHGFPEVIVAIIFVILIMLAFNFISTIFKGKDNLR